MTTTHADIPRRRLLPPWLIWVVKIVVSLGLLVVLLSRVDVPRLWQTARTASVPWLVTALGIYFVMIVVSAWRWLVLLRAQQVPAAFGWLLNSYLVATFFNNFLPSNIGGDVIRIRDTAAAAGSKTLATTIVLLDRGLGLIGLVFVAAVGSSLAARSSAAVGPLGPGLLWLGLVAGVAAGAFVIFSAAGVAWLLAPLERLQKTWLTERIQRLTDALARFRAKPGAVATGLAGAVLVQAVLVLFYVAVARGLAIPISAAHLAILVPVSFIVQMLPVSVNGFGVREATFTLFFSRLHLPIESALALSFIGAVLIMLFSTTGAVANLSRRRQQTP